MPTGWAPFRCCSFTELKHASDFYDCRKNKKGFVSGREVVVKKSSFDEVKKIEAARRVFDEHELVLGGVPFRFHLPKIYDYRSGNIFMEFLHGENLEIALRTDKHRPEAVQTVNRLFQYLYDKQILLCANSRPNGR